MDILQKLNAAIKSITTSTISAAGGGLLNPMQAERFIRAVEDSTPLLQAARRLPMSAPTRNIDRIAFAGRLLQGQTETVPVSNDQTVTPFLNQLVMKELGGYVEITDQLLEDNIERANLESTIIDLMGSQTGRDLEYLFLAGDETNTADDLLKVTDGWLKLAANAVEGAATPSVGEFDELNPIDMLEKMLLSIPDKYFNAANDWAFWVPRSTENDIRNWAINRQTPLGDSIFVNNNQIYFKGIPIRKLPQMPADSALLAPSSNLVYGIYRDIRIEPERDAKGRKTDFVLTLRADCNYEDENAACTATGYVGGVVIVDPSQ